MPLHRAQGLKPDKRSCAGGLIRGVEGAWTPRPRRRRHSGFCTLASGIDL